MGVGQPILSHPMAPPCRRPPPGHQPGASPSHLPHTEWPPLGRLLVSPSLLTAAGCTLTGSQVPRSHTTQGVPEGGWSGRSRPLRVLEQRPPDGPQGTRERATQLCPDGGAGHQGSRCPWLAPETQRSSDSLAGDVLLASVTRLPASPGKLSPEAGAAITPTSWLVLGSGSPRGHST